MDDLRKVSPFTYTTLTLYFPVCGRSPEFANFRRPKPLSWRRSYPARVGGAEGAGQGAGQGAGPGLPGARHEG